MALDLFDSVPDPNLKRKQLGEALLVIVEELQDDYTRINPERDRGDVVYVEALTLTIKWLFGLELGRRDTASYSRDPVRT